MGGINSMTEYLYKYYPIVDYALQSLKNEEVCFNSMRAFRDKREGKFHMAAKEPGLFGLNEKVAGWLSVEYSDRIIGQIRVLSLTKKYNMKYMWEKYANNGAGFCIEYKCQDLLQISTDISEILYSDENGLNAYFEDSLNDESFSKAVREILFTKEKKWELENETRLIYKLPPEMGKLIGIDEFMENKYSQKSSECEYVSDFIMRQHYKFPMRIMKKCVPNKIYLGPQISKESEEIIKEIISNRNYVCEKISEQDLQ